MNEELFIQLLKEKRIEINDKQLKQFEIYYSTLVEWNEKMNLTAITAKNEVYLKHFYDSLTPAFYFPFEGNMTVCDVGAGAGFPSLPLKIIFPELQVTIVDSLNKRITFLDHLAKQLNLQGVNFYHDRAETFGQNKKFRESFDIVTARAVARLSVLSELCLPLAKVGGTFLALKGPQFQEEEKDAQSAIHQLGGEWNEVHAFALPEEGSERHLAVVKKIKTTPKRYPRKPGIPNKSPIS
ncbi:16S rRNA (guanine527-N7)-methyltransferase [Salirhabdus euzebyi]|uniref:Ribosomal RNA small subunit methyltransferase G n=1 Tax=Salirhabdus euzebyi TaxID=394506 RepID=A0A841Q795_9BACI|nr:16S rRNA (guanine(527)-N(7))-methyltransferase RsmG [Salirhabdus euzebyi]MBB6454429.1 16S rRNA (guanine527-N7)-methyltransferase [Salirhabdus euzebyi]